MKTEVLFYNDDDHDDYIKATLTEPDTKVRGTIIGAPGLGGTKEMGYPIWTDEYERLGYRSVIFDYRGFGSSSTKSVQEGDLNYIEQRKDYQTVYNDMKRTFGDVNLLGYSYSGAHVINMMANNPDIKKGMINTPYTGMLDTAINLPVDQLFLTVMASIEDIIRKKLGLGRRYIGISEKKRIGYIERNQGDKYEKMGDDTFKSRVTASEAIHCFNNKPKKDIKNIRDDQRTMFLLALKDSVCPPLNVFRLAKQINSKIHMIEGEHVDVFTPEVAEKHIKFLEE